MELTPDQVDKQAENAADFASELYKITTKTLMAHTIRAFERFMLNTYKEPFRVRVYEDLNVKNRTDAISYIRYGKKYAEIFLQKDIDADQKRVCIAHELYHVILAANLGQIGEDGRIVLFNKIKTDRVEDICDLFARDICYKHHLFYIDEQNVKSHCQFSQIRCCSYRDGEYDPRV